VLGVVLLALAALALLWLWWPPDRPDPIHVETTRPATPPSRPLADDPRLTFPTPYRNVRPEVRYVGDAVCARCHPGHAESYHHHAMGRSLAPVAAVADAERYDEAARNPFQAHAPEFAAPLTYTVARRGDRVFHRAAAMDAQGRELAALEAEVHYAVGSGSRGRSYLINRDGFLFMSPITWYPQRGLWDLSPGYAVQHHHFGRPIIADCLFCHANQVEPVPHTLNRYEPLADTGPPPELFRGYTIGCERCHGPGELHVERQRRGPVTTAPFDDTIVNPSRLEPALRDAVCQQCHLQGQSRILRRGREPFDYRPGLPLHLFLAVFVKPPELSGDNKFVGHVEQMHASVCFQKSAGKMSCTSCHDPHALPAPDRKVSFYRGRCLSCHGEHDCSLPPPARREQSREDNCIQCHMPLNDSNIKHTSVTDHRIPRRPSPPATRPWEGTIPLVHFHRELVDPQGPDVSRELGIAAAELAEKTPGPFQVPLAQNAQHLLTPVVERDPDDLAAADALGVALWVQGRQREAAATFTAVLKRAPRREATLDIAASVAMELRRYEEAAASWERAIRVNPWRWQYHYGLAAAHAHQHNWHSATHAAEQALRLNPFALEARRLLVECYLALGRTAEARAEFDRLLGFRPPDADALRERYAGRLRE
jgi:Flp pilus assembly protein TadD